MDRRSRSWRVWTTCAHVAVGLPYPYKPIVIVHLVFRGSAFSFSFVSFQRWPLDDRRFSFGCHTSKSSLPRGWKRVPASFVPPGSFSCHFDLDASQLTAVGRPAHSKRDTRPARALFIPAALFLSLGPAFQRKQTADHPHRLASTTLPFDRPE